MSLGHRVLPKNDLHWGVRRGTKHFPAGAAHRCFLAPVRLLRLWSALGEKLKMPIPRPLGPPLAPALREVTGLLLSRFRYGG